MDEHMEEQSFGEHGLPVSASMTVVVEPASCMAPLDGGMSERVIIKPAENVDVDFDRADDAYQVDERSLPSTGPVPRIPSFRFDAAHLMTTRPGTGNTQRTSTKPILKKGRGTTPDRLKPYLVSLNQSATKLKQTHIFKMKKNSQPNLRLTTNQPTKSQSALSHRENLTTHDYG